jgi:hypothetical protein
MYLVTLQKIRMGYARFGVRINQIKSNLRAILRIPSRCAPRKPVSLICPNKRFGSLELPLQHFIGRMDGSSLEASGYFLCNIYRQARWRNLLVLRKGVSKLLAKIMCRPGKSALVLGRMTVALTELLLTRQRHHKPYLLLRLAQCSV